MLYYWSSTVCRLTRETGILSKNAFSLSFTDGNGDKCLRCGALFSYPRMDGTLCVPYIFIIYLCKSLRTDVSMHQTNSSKSLKICGVVFDGNIFYFSRNDFFSFDRSNMQIFTVNITRVVWPHVTNVLDLRYFCEHNPLFYHLNLIPCRYWSWQRNIYFLVNIFVRHTFPMSNSSIKTKTILTMTDMTQSTELRALEEKRMVKKLL